ncbi:rod shape-determining protein MreD [Planktotalea sp.]|uniref:rod shape-determining protein MreD n=1 Tax=Planktotalea sp. TaxID=2029877 RepID=UPI0032992E6C
MVDPITSRMWFMRCVYLFLAFLLIFLQLLPLETVPNGWAAPDWLMALTLAWALRRPEYVPAINVACVFLLADLLFQRPPGLQAALMVVAAEVLRARALANRDTPYLVEWMSVAGMMIGVALTHRIFLAIFFIPAPSLRLVLIQLGMTIALYPIVVVVSHVIFKVRRAAPGEVDALGHRL